MRDLKRGSNLPPPTNYPSFQTTTNGWLRERVDLARVAFDELIRREKAGKLSDDYRHQIEELEIANLSAPVTNPVQWYLDEDLSDRLAAGRLSPDQKANFFDQAVTMHLSADPLVMQWDDVPIQIRSQASLPDSRWDIAATYVSACIDGNDVSWWNGPRWNRPFVQYLPNGPCLLAQSIPYSTLGLHRIDLTMRLDIRHLGTSSPASGPIIHSELRTLSTTFVEIPPTATMKMLRFAVDPKHEAGHYLSERVLEQAIRFPVPYFRDLAITELIRRGRLKELSGNGNASLIDGILSIQRNRAQLWITSYGDYLEEQRSTKKVSDSQWKEYGRHQLDYCVRVRSPIRDRDPLPLNLITLPRRGNSEVEQFPASQWSLHVEFSPDVPGPVRLTYWQGIDFVVLTGDVSDLSNPGYVTRYLVSLPNARSGVHGVRAHVTLTDMTFIKHPQQLEIPSEYDLGSTEFTVVPSTTQTITPVGDPNMVRRIQQCIEISTLTRGRDSLLIVEINMHRPPIDLAFHVSILAGGREWPVGDIFTAKGLETDAAYNSFNIKDTKSMPSDGLVFQFTADPEMERQLAGNNECWNGEITLRGISIRDDAYLKPRPRDLK
jgi:hypothetical protein